jgi:hypothetical protein
MRKNAVSSLPPVTAGDAEVASSKRVGLDATIRVAVAYHLSTRGSPFEARPALAGNIHEHELSPFHF